MITSFDAKADLQLKKKQSNDDIMAHLSNNKSND